MIVYYKIIISLFSTSLMNGVYHRDLQACSYSFLVNKNWDLTIFENGTYIYSTKTTDTRVKKQREENLFGNWQMVGDTLKLEKPKVKSLNLSFLLKENKLVPLERNINTIGSEICLDYLEKTR